MSITTELREYASLWDKEPVRNNLFRFADRIDAEVADMQAFCDRLREAAESREDVTLFGVDYVALPVDADGVPIHVGDKMTGWGTLEYDDLGDDEVWGLLLKDDGWEVDGKTRIVSRKPCQLRHHTPSTVEDVLEEFAQIYIACNDKGTIAEYAAKLRLRGEDE